jgi:hypothetical protein
MTRRFYFKPFFTTARIFMRELLLKRNLVVMLFALSLMFGCKAKPTETPAIETKINGKIVDKDNNNAIVGVQVTTNPTTSSVSTDASGSYTISDVKSGQYVVSAAKSGYSTNSINVVVVEGKTSAADIQLETLKPGLVLSTPALDFGTAQTTTTFIISNATSIGTINFSIAKSADWLSLSSTSGTITTGTATITVTASRTNLSFGNFSTTLSITSNGGNKDIGVTMTVANPNAPQLTVNPLLLDFSSNLSQLPFTIRNSGTGKIDWTASSGQQWITLVPSKDSTRTEVDQVTVTVNRNSLPPADYTGEITITSNAGSQTVNVKMNVPVIPALSLSKNTLDFDTTKTQLSFNVDNGGSGSLNWVASSNQSWISMMPSAGSNSGTVNVTVNRSGLTPGNYSGTVTVSSNGGNGAISVNMKVTPPPPPQPVTLTVGTARTNSVQLSWTEYIGTDFSAYKIYYSTSPTVSENSTLASSIIAKTTTTLTVSGLTLGTTYYFKAYILSESQQTAGSNTVSGTTTSTLPSWQQVALPLNFQVQSMHYISESNIWIAGYTTIGTYNFPRIYHYDGGVWNQSTIQAEDSVGTLSSIAFRNNSDGLAFGSGKIYKYDGTSWKIFKYLSTEYKIYDAIGTSTDIWFYGQKVSGSNFSSLIYRYNGTTFTELLPTTSTAFDYRYINDLHFYTSTTGFAVDYYGDAFMFNGSGWINLGDIGSNIRSISGTSKNDVWASDASYLYRYNGTMWSRQNDIGGSGITYSFGQIRMVSSTEGWAIKHTSPYDVYFYNGSTWTKTGTASGFIAGIKDFGNGNLWGIISGSPNKLMRLQ